MRLYDSANGDELRFPAANTVLTSESVYEFPAVWPDIPPMSSKLYQITFPYTLKCHKTLVNGNLHRILHKYCTFFTVIYLYFYS